MKLILLGKKKFKNVVLQGGLDPKILLLSEKKKLKKCKKIFRYIFKDCLIFLI
jgi:uroporphyrinogen-III decarboxylase